MILDATQTPDRLPAAVTRQTVDQAVIRKFAPRVYLHREERFLPTSVEHFVQNSRLFNGKGELIAESITLDDLAKHPEEGNYLQLKDSSARLGMPLQNGKCVPPIYVKANCEHDAYDELIYMFFFGFSGYQMFRGSIFRIKTLSYVKRNFEWRDFGGHEGDWEHITVRISKNHQSVLGVYYARHEYGKGNWSAPGSPDYNYPNVYLALNSHASYGQEAIITTKSIEEAAVPSLTAGMVRWLKTVDVTANESPVMYAST
ncbi:MAG: Vps62-related protein, partial [Caldilineaceae bacterium]|nr:Vps62-related protein [Caldilineaceae bacterium]